MVGALGLIGLFLAFSPAYTDRLGLLVFDGNGVRWVGVVLFTAGGVLRLGPVFVLGPRFSGLVAIQPGHTLVTGGIYGRIRNPSYLGLVVNMLGWALTFRSGAGVLLTALAVPILIARIHSCGSYVSTSELSTMVIVPELAPASRGLLKCCRLGKTGTHEVGEVRGTAETSERLHRLAPVRDYTVCIGPGYCANRESVVSRMMPSTIACATRTRSNGSW